MNSALGVETDDDDDKKKTDKEKKGEQSRRTVTKLATNEASSSDKARRLRSAPRFQWAVPLSNTASQPASFTYT